MYYVYQYDPEGNRLQTESVAAFGRGYGAIDMATYDAYGVQTADLDTNNGAPAPTHPSIGYGNLTDPETGWFLNRDPIGYSGGINLYGYAGNNSVNGVDPEGMTGLDSADLARFAVLRKAAFSRDGNLTTKDVASLIQGCIAVLSKQISKSKGTSDKDDPARLRAAWWAIDHLGDTEYGGGAMTPKSSSFNYLSLDGESKCNIFVADSYASVVGVGGSYLISMWFSIPPQVILLVLRSMVVAPMATAQSCWETMSLFMRVVWR